MKMISDTLIGRLDDYMDIPYIRISGKFTSHVNNKTIDFVLRKQDVTYVKGDEVDSLNESYLYVGGARVLDVLEVTDIEITEIDTKFIGGTYKAKYPTYIDYDEGFPKFTKDFLEYPSDWGGVVEIPSGMKSDLVWRTTTTVTQF